MNDPTPRVQFSFIIVTCLERLRSLSAMSICLSVGLYVLFERRVLVMFFVFFTIVSHFSCNVKDSIRTVLPEWCPRSPIILFVERSEKWRDWLFESSCWKRIILTSVFVSAMDLIAYDSETGSARMDQVVNHEKWQWTEQRTKDFFCPSLVAVAVTFSLSLSLSRRWRWQTRQ